MNCYCILPLTRAVGMLRAAARAAGVPHRQRRLFLEAQRDRAVG
ncbi:MAG: hypothetical protein R2697_11820 [Ilumatobacteraceae bacterium]